MECHYVLDRSSLLDLFPSYLPTNSHTGTQSSQVHDREIAPIALPPDERSLSLHPTLPTHLLVLFIHENAKESRLRKQSSRHAE